MQVASYATSRQPEAACCALLVVKQLVVATSDIIEAVGDFYASILAGGLEQLLQANVPIDNMTSIIMQFVAVITVLIVFFKC
jgi:hypothetical protein